MQALQARLVVGLFVGLSAAITYNAIYMQKGPHPAPFAEGGNKLTQNGKASRTARNARSQRPTAPEPDIGTVRAVQRELAQRGYEPGPVDGIFGVVTRAAVLAYQNDQGLALTGLVTPALLQRIVLGNGSGGPSQVPKETEALISAIQQTLAGLGYAPGPVDGIQGAGTRKAIKQFEGERGLPEKGRVSGRLLTEILRVTGTKLADLPSG